MRLRRARSFRGSFICGFSSQACYTITQNPSGVNTLETDPLARFVRGVPQIVPERWCLECKVCCRFPDTEGVQSPRWSSQEAGWARQAGGEEGWFVSRPGSPSLAPKLTRCAGSDGYRCPAFQPETNRCGIHSVKPLDCRLYPFVLARTPGGDQALLAVDTKCPYVQAHLNEPALTAYASELFRYLDQPAAEEYLDRNPEIIGPFWPEYLSVAAFPAGQRRLAQATFRLPHPTLQPLSDADRDRLRALLWKEGRSCSRWTLAGLLGWQDLVRTWWASLSGGMGLFCEQAGGVYMPIPPVGTDSAPQALREGWRILEEANHGGAVSRIEGIEPRDLPLMESAGFRVERTDREYLYRMSDLAGLRGNRYRSQRWAVNRFRRSVRARYRPFEERDLASCLQLYTAWAIRRQRAERDPHARRLVRDNLYFQRRLMMDRARLGVLGRVLEAEEGILAYSFGGPVSEETFCVFLEIADRKVPGAAQTLFQEFCRELGSFRTLNAMGDEGLEGLRQAKLGFHPAGWADVFTVELKGFERPASLAAARDSGSATRPS